MLMLTGLALVAMAALDPVPDAGVADVDAGPVAPDADAGPAAPDADAGPAAPGVDAGPTAPDVDAGPAAADGDDEAVITDEERAAIEAALAGEDARSAAGAPSAVPDLSKVNVGAALPGALQSMNPDISFILDVAAAAFSRTAANGAGGVAGVPQQTGAHDPTRNGFTLQQLEMSVGASVDPFLRLDSNIVFALFGVEIEEAYATTLGLPANLQLRAGQFLTRFGRINPTHPHQWAFVDQVLMTGRYFGPEGSRGLGVEGSWLAPLPWYLEAVVSTTNADGACCARSFLGADDIGVKTPLDLLVTGAVKQFFPLGDDLSLFVGVSAQLGPNASGNGNRTEIFGTDLVLRYRPVQAGDAGRWAVSLEAEALVRGRQVPFGALHDGGGYAQIVWQMNPQWETGARYELLSGVVDDPLDPAWVSWRQRGSLVLTYRPTHFSRLRVQGAADHLTWEQGLPGFAIFAQLEVVVGAHGAHSY